MNSPPASRPLRVAAVQNAAGGDQAANLARLEELLPAPGEVDLIALPEVFALRGDDDDYRAAAEPCDGGVGRWLAAQARARQAWILGGSIIERDGAACYNSALLVAPDGRLAARYRKLHLFEAVLDDGRRIREDAVFTPGDRPVTVRIDGWMAGLAICYDVRFPELFRHYSAAGARLLLLPSNFTQRTGRDHWEILVRARAIENQCYVIAPDQCGRNPRGAGRSHGHSLIVGPWGDILAAAGDDEQTLRATLDPVTLEATRARVPALQHRRLWQNPLETPP